VVLLWTQGHEGREESKGKEICKGGTDWELLTGEQVHLGGGAGKRPGRDEQSKNQRWAKRPVDGKGLERGVRRKKSFRKKTLAPVQISYRKKRPG